VGALSCALRPEWAQHAPTARALKAAGAHPGGFPARRPSPAPIEPHLHPALVLRSSCARRGITPAYWLRTPLGVGPTGLPPASNTASPARTTARSDSRSSASPFPGFAGYRRARSRRTAATGTRRVSPVPRTAIRTFNALYAGGFLGARFRIPGAFHGLRRRVNGSAPSTPSKDGPLDDASQASLTLQTARSHPLRFAPGLSTTRGSITTKDPDISSDRTHTGRPP
jgi:hypothetical protein